MPKPGQPEMRPDSRGERVHLADLKVGDIVDHWHKRSGGFFLKENLHVIHVSQSGAVRCAAGIVLHTDVNWGEIRRLNSERN